MYTVALLLSLAVALVSGKVNPDTVDSLDVPKYLGLWYQMYADEAVIKSFETDSYCCTALYGDNADGTLSVHNYASQNDPTGAVPYTIDGYAYQTNPEEYPGQLKVVFNSDDAFAFPAPYWILELGPINSNGQYDYAIVSDSVSAFLFVLARDVETYYAKYDAQVQQTLKDLGFTGATAPIKTYQGRDCVYETNTRVAQMMKDRASVASNVTVATGGSCADLKSEKSCMSGSEGSTACSWCSSGAVSDACYKETDAKALPSSVFECEFQ